MTTATQSTPTLMPALGLDIRQDFCWEIIGAGERPTASQRAEAASLKLVVFDGLVRAMESGLPKSAVVVWADHDLGEGALLRTRALGLPVAVAIDRPGRRDTGIAFEDTAEAWNAANKLSAKYVIARLEYSYADPVPRKQKLQEQLRVLLGRCREAGRGLIIDLAPTPAPQQIAEHGGKITQELMTLLIIESMRDLQDASIEPVAWAVVPPSDRLAAATIAAQARVDDRQTGVLFQVGSEPDPGRLSAGPTRTDRALVRMASRTTGADGVVVGPDAYFAAIASLHKGIIDRGQAVDTIASYLRKLWELYQDSRHATEVS